MGSRGDLIQFGIPSLDDLFGANNTDGTNAGIRLASPAEATSLTILGPSGTGKSIIALHLISKYLTDCYVDPAHTPRVLYVSTDFNFNKAHSVWQQFGLNCLQRRNAPFSSASAVPCVELDFLAGRPSDESLAELLSKETGPNIIFVDLASSTAGDDWGFLNRMLSVLETPPISLDDELKSEPRHLVIVDAVEGLEAFVGARDAFGLKSSRRSRIVQLMRSAARKAHVVLIVENHENRSAISEDFVTDSVIVLRSAQTRNYLRRTIEIEKVRGQHHARGQHPIVIRSGKGSRTGDAWNPDDPPRTHAYVHVFHSVHHIGRHLMETESRSRSRLPEGKYAAFGIPYLDDMLAGEAETVYQRRGADTRGLPCSTITALIGDAGTQKTNLGIAFLSRAFAAYARRLELLISQICRFPDKDGNLQTDLIEGSLLALGSAEGEVKHCIQELRASTESNVENWLRRHCARVISNDLPSLGTEIEQRISAAISAAGHMLTQVSKCQYHSDDGYPILLTTRDTDRDELAAQIVRFLSTRPSDLRDAVEQRLQNSADTRDRNYTKETLERLVELYRAELRTHVVGATTCRRFEIHDLPPAVMLHIIREAIGEGQRRMFNSNMQSDPNKRFEGSWRIRLVLEDLSTIRELYPELGQDPLLLPYLIFHIGREGPSTLIIETQQGRPDLVSADSFDNELRTLVPNHLHTWHVPFFGEDRVAIATIPPMRTGREVTVRELTSTAKDLPWVNPHFELYAGLEQGRPQRVPLQIRLYEETPAFRAYIEQENLLFNQRFSAAPGFPNVITGEPVASYDVLRDVCSLQGDTKIEYSVIIQVDEFWAVRRAGSFANQSEYLLAQTADRHGIRFEEVDPFGTFQVSESEKKATKAVVRKRRHQFFTITEHDLARLEHEPAKAKLIDRVPFMWDFGFLLCRQRAWEEAAKETLKDGKTTIEAVWDRLRQHRNSERENIPPDQPVSWRLFFEACQRVAAARSVRLGSSVPAFDLAVVVPESFSCLVLEIWSSEICSKAWPTELCDCRSMRDWRSPANGGLPALVHTYKYDLFRTFLLLSEVLNFASLIDSTHVFEFQVRTGDANAVAARHWYKTASAFEEKYSPADPVIPVRLPGRFSVRGDWFLAVPSGSRSRRLTEHAMDLINSRRANFTRLQMGLGLPVRDLISSDQNGSLRTKLFRPDSEGRRTHVSYSDLLKLGGVHQENHRDQDTEFSWFWRSGLRFYHRHARIWQKWLHRVMLWWDNVTAEEGVRRKSEFDSYDRGVDWTQMDFKRWGEFESLIAFLIAELEQATPGAREPR